MYSVNIMDDTQVKEEVVEDVVDGEVVEDAGVVNGAAVGDDAATAMLSLEELIKNHIESTDRMRDEIKKVREMFEDSFNNNPTYREASEQAKDVAKKRNQVKQQVTKQPSV